MAQTAVAVIGAGAVISAVDWKMVVSSPAVAGVVSTSTASVAYSRGYRGQIKPSVLLRREGRKEENMERLLIDVSEHNGVIDWETAKKTY